MGDGLGHDLLKVALAEGGAEEGRLDGLPRVGRAIGVGGDSAGAFGGLRPPTRPLHPPLCSEELSPRRDGEFQGVRTRLQKQGGWLPLTPRKRFSVDSVRSDSEEARALRWR